MMTLFPEYYLKQELIVQTIKERMEQSNHKEVICLKGGANRSKGALIKQVAKKMNKTYIRVGYLPKKKGYIIKEKWNEAYSKNGCILHLDGIDFQRLNGTYDLIKGLNIHHCLIIQTEDSHERDMKLVVAT
jgi:hypothetical protein